jgi:septal ring factor EnvC (AmiA/AmiB activator)
MQERLKKRLDDLTSEYETGQKMLAELDAKRQNLTQTLLRIEGAIQVLREALSAEAPASDGGEPAPPRA